MVTVTPALRTRVDGGLVGLVRRAGRSRACMLAWRVARAVCRNGRSAAVGRLVRQPGETVYDDWDPRGVVRYYGLLLA